MRSLPLHYALFLTLLLPGLSCGIADEEGEAAPSPYARWENGPSTDPAYFPIGVWLQNPDNAERYREAGINVYIGLWQGPTENQLAQLRRAGMQVICRPNAVGLAHRDDPTIIAWMHDDEPDNAQPQEGPGWGPPVPPEQIVVDYLALREQDPTRPVYLNLGQGVAWDGWHGRGERTNHPEDYPRYIEGTDIVSFDIYPAVHSSPEVAGKLEYVARGVERLVQWSSDDQIVWNIIEASRIHNAAVKPTPHQIRAEVWMSLIHGSKGITYFVHQFEPTFKEASLLDDLVLLPAVTELNHQIHRLAPVLNSPSVSGVSVTTSDEAVPVKTLVKRHDDALYVFAVAMRDAPVDVSIDISSLGTFTEVEVLDEDRTLPVQGGAFEDSFEGYGVHLYRLQGN